MTTSSIARSQDLERSRIVSLAPWLSRLVMIPPTIILILVGARYIANPAHGASPTGVILFTPEAVTDTRVVGAIALSVAFAIVTSIASLARLRIGHATVVAVMALILAVRFLGFAHDGTTLATGDQRVKVIGEIVFLSLNTVGFALQTYLARQLRVQA
jgi:hypothetical protein